LILVPKTTHFYLTVRTKHLKTVTMGTLLTVVVSKQKSFNATKWKIYTGIFILFLFAMLRCFTIFLFGFQIFVPVF